VARSKGKRVNKKTTGKGKYRSAVTGRYVSAKHGKSAPKTTIRESKASKFAERFIREHPETFHELSKR
jgi:hypothetical protein